ncbi:MAG TPA: hypothetical protein VLH56_02410 [Dissulfurispiraceae bacterium]|nr:hypothetical protein [Dissulfurispiraceae bacterium]
MAVKFTYSETSPATVCEFERDPPMGGYSINRRWMNPATASGAGVSFVYDKSLVRDIEILKWNVMTVADVAKLLAFLDAVDGSANPFDYRDVSGNVRVAHIWNSDEIRSYPIQILLEGITIELFILPWRKKSLYDILSMTDLFSRAVAYNRTIGDAISMSDQFYFMMNGAWIMTPADIISMSDVAVIGTRKNRADSITMSDSMLMEITQEGYLTDESGNHITDESGNHIIVKTA